MVREHAGRLAGDGSPGSPAIGAPVEIGRVAADTGIKGLAGATRTTTAPIHQDKGDADVLFPISEPRHLVPGSTRIIAPPQPVPARTVEKSRRPVRIDGQALSSRSPFPVARHPGRDLDTDPAPALIGRPMDGAARRHVGNAGIDGIGGQTLDLPAACQIVGDRQPGFRRPFPAISATHIGAGIEWPAGNRAGNQARDKTAAIDAHVLPGTIRGARGRRSVKRLRLRIVSPGRAKRQKKDNHPPKMAARRGNER